MAGIDSIIKRYNEEHNTDVKRRSGLDSIISRYNREHKQVKLPAIQPEDPRNIPGKPAPAPSSGSPLRAPDNPLTMRDLSSMTSEELNELKSGALRSDPVKPYSAYEMPTSTERRQAYDTYSSLPQNQLTFKERELSELTGREQRGTRSDYAQRAGALEREISDLRARSRQYEDNKYYFDMSTSRNDMEAVRNSADFGETVKNASPPDVGLFSANQNGRRAVRYLTDPVYRAAEQVTSFRGGVADAESGRLEHLTPDEKDVLLYYAAKGDYGKVEEYLSALERTLDERMTREASRTAEQVSYEHPILGAFANVGGSFAAPLAYLGNAGQVISNAVTGDYAPTNINSPLFYGANVVGSTSQGIHQKAYDSALEATGSETWAEIAAFAADTGLSMGQFASKLPMGSAALGFLGAGAAGQTTLDALQRGADPGEALRLGTISGAVEALTEKLPLDNLFKLAQGGARPAREAIIGILKQAGIEATEEMVSELAGTIADNAVMGNRSEYSLYVQSLVSQGMSQKDAEAEAAKQFYVFNTLKAGAGGALSGGVMGAGGAAYGAIGNRIAGNTRTQSPPSAQAPQLGGLLEAPRGAENQGNTSLAQNIPLPYGSITASTRDMDTASITAGTLGSAGERAFNSVIETRRSSGAEPNAREMYPGFALEYHAGQTGRPSPRAAGLSSFEREAAYHAGEMDAPKLIRDDNFKKATLTSKEANMLDALARVSGTQISFVPSIAGADGKASGANATYRNGKITIALDAQNPVQVAALHEVAHSVAQKSPEVFSDIREAIYEIMEERGAGDKYMQSYDRRYELYSKGGNQELTSSDLREELTADALSYMLQDGEMMRRFARTHRNAAQRVYDAIRDLIIKVQRMLTNKNVKLTEAQRSEFKELENHLGLLSAAFEAAMKSSQAGDAVVSGDTRQSLNLGFPRAFDAWLATTTEAERKTSPGNFFVGTTSDALKSIGMDDYKIYWRKAKIDRIMREHPDMTAQVIKNVPGIIENPIIVMQSQTSPNRITVFGEVLDSSKNPVLVALELKPTNKRGEIMDYAIITSAYGKDNAQNLINSSDILYVDPNKNRTDTWTEQLGLQLPSRLTKYGSIDNITYVGKNIKGQIEVKSDSPEAGKTAMQIALEKARAEKESGGEKFSLKEYSEKELKDNAAAVLEHFGRTYRWAETGYLLRDGEKLDFSGKHDGAPGGYRTVDHRDIRDALGDDYGGDDYSGAMIEFMNEGNIRITPENDGFNLSVPPTKAQERALDDYISRVRGEVIMDIDRANGDTVVSIEYPRGTRASKIMTDIRQYFETGAHPVVSEVSRFRYSLKDDTDLAAKIRDTDITVPERVQIETLASRLLKDYSSRADATALAAALEEAYSLAEGGAELPELAEAIMPAARDIVMNASVLNDKMAQEYKELRSILRETRFNVPDGVKADFTDFNTFRKANMGKFVIAKNGREIDSVFSELSERWPNFFDTVKYTHPADQLMRVAEVLDSLKATYENPNAGHIDEAAEELVADIIERMYSDGRGGARQGVTAVLDKAARRRYDALVKEFGAFPKGEKPVRDVTVPQAVSATERVSRFLRTAMEAGAIPDSMIPSFEREILNKSFTYEPIKDKTAVARAENTVQTMGEDSARRQWNAAFEGDKMGKDDIALGELLLARAAAKGDVEDAMKLTAEIAAMGTRAGQTVQAMRLLKKMTGAGQLYYTNKMVEQMQKDLIKKYKGNAPKLEIPQGMIEELLAAQTTQDIEAANDRILTAIAAQVPAQWTDKWNAWRYMAMLGNPRTHIRNIVGNAVFMPAVTIKNVIKSGLEAGVDAASRASGGQGINRTTDIRAVLPGTGGEYRTFAIEDFANMKDILTSGGKMNPSDIIRDRQKIFKTKWLEAFRKFNYNLLELEDGIFLKNHYVRALTGYLLANNVDINTLNIADDTGYRLLEKARLYAINEAQRATYRDASAFAAAASKFSRANTAANITVEGIMPFKKTPVNILKRGLEYSPLGLLETLSRQSVKLKQGKTTVNDWLDRMAQGLTGTGVMALGMFLRSIGLLTGGMGDDKEDALRRMMGEQEYAINTSSGSYTIDWMAPLSLPLFVGAEVMDAIRGEGMELNFSDVADAAAAITEPMFNLSMLNGLNDTLGAVQYGDDNVLTSVAGQVIAGYFGQAVPTLAGQVARTIDDTRRRTYTDKNMPIPADFQYYFQRNINKIPGVSMTSEPYVDLWGRQEIEQNVAMRGFENFLSPGYTARARSSAMERQLLELYGATGDNAVLPSAPSRYFNVDKERRDLSAKEYTKYATERGTLSHNLLVELADSAGYYALDDAEKVNVISNTYTYADQIAKLSVDSRYEPDKWVINAADTCRSLDMLLPEYLILKTLYGDAFTGEDALPKLQAAYSGGVGVVTYLDTRKAVTDYGKVSGESEGLTQEEAEEALDRTSLTKEQKAVMWSQLNSAWKASNNPYLSFSERIAARREERAG